MFVFEDASSLTPSSLLFQDLRELHNIAVVPLSAIQNFLDAGRNPQQDARVYCRTHGCVFQAYGSLRLLNDSRYEQVRNISQSIGARRGQGATAALLRWLVRQDIGVVTTATSLRQMAANYQAIAGDWGVDELTEHEIADLSTGHFLLA